MRNVNLLHAGVLRRTLCLCAFAIGCIQAVAHGATFAHTDTFNDPIISDPGNFGGAVDIDGTLAIVGALSDNTNGIQVGRAFLFDIISGNLLHTFDDPTATSVDYFGDSVAIDGDSVAIGAPLDESGGARVGQVHLFNAQTGALIRTFDDPTPTSNDRFGGSIAIDGNYLLVGASGDDTNGDNVGQAHLFNASTGDLIHTFNDPTVTAVDLFGFSVAIEGDYVVIGAQGDDTEGEGVGQVHIFSASGGNLLYTLDDPTNTGLEVFGDKFGHSVAIDDGVIAVGAETDRTQGEAVGQAYLFDASSGGLLHILDDPTPLGGDVFSEVDIDGGYVVVGAFGDETHGPIVGQAHVFDVVTGELIQTLDDPSVAGLDAFGYDVAIYGGAVLIGSFSNSETNSNPGPSEAYLFTIIPEPGSLWFLLGCAGLIARRRRFENGRCR